MTTGHISPLFLSAVMPPAPACRATSRARRDPTGSPAIDESKCRYMSLYVSICRIQRWPLVRIAAIT